jgi:hypothetical protein
MSSKLQNLIQKTLGDGARAAKFAIHLNIPSSSKGTPAISENILNILCKSSSYPGKTIEPINITYKGRSIPIPGQVKYSQTWELTFYLEENHSSRLYFLDWMQALNNANESYYVGATSGQTATMRKGNNNNKSQNIKDLSVKQLNFDMDKSTAEYTLYNCYPSAVGDVTISSDTVGQVLEYTVTFSFSHFIIQSKSESFDIGV